MSEITNITSFFFNFFTADEIETLINQLRVIFRIIAIPYITLVILSLALIPAFLRRKHHIDNLESWKKLQEYPVINHAFYVIKNPLYIGFLLVQCALFPIAVYMVMSSSWDNSLMLILATVESLVFLVGYYIVGLFIHVYLVLMAYEIAMATNDKLLDEQAAKKKIWIKSLYALFIGKDSLLKLVLFLFDCALVSYNPELKYMQISDVAGTIFTVTIHLMADFAVIGVFLLVDHRRNIHFLIKLLGATSMALPLIIQATTIICFKKN
ncbi:hypothetical protein GCK72_020747 [Caenorhabditis remanei]|uniref:Uncharacterized protein n=1 Tax=Caenorhabditis remanei TaxID=31234 RepID=A0A6A5GG42_CAERE|nr:hypothetical protein GCK72_020747 [Caenorhabditis remanei]KAF1754187.1 hypothetical protein GCK72_020747 [Caenorhabditis remanei]